MPDHKLRPGELTDDEIMDAVDNSFPRNDTEVMRAIATAAYSKAMRRAAEITMEWADVQTLLLRAGEMTTSEKRTCIAVTKAIVAIIEREAK